MQHADSVTWLEALSSAGFLWGPFFFSILFMLVITRIAHSYYAGAPAASEEKQVYRLYFLGSGVVGFLLVFVSVGWWMYAQLQKHTFEGVIIGLDPRYQIVATDDDLYFREIRREAGPGRLIRDYHFAIVKNAPFTNGQAFRLGLFPESGVVGDKKPEPIDLEIRYNGGSQEKFVLRQDGNSFRLFPVGR